MGIVCQINQEGLDTRLPEFAEAFEFLCGGGAADGFGHDVAHFGSEGLHGGVEADGDGFAVVFAAQGQRAFDVGIETQQVAAGEASLRTDAAEAGFGSGAG